MSGQAEDEEEGTTIRVAMGILFLIALAFLVVSLAEIAGVQLSPFGEIGQPVSTALMALGAALIALPGLGNDDRLPDPDRSKLAGRVVFIVGLVAYILGLEL